jgi:hypothetical protein
MFDRSRRRATRVRVALLTATVLAIVLATVTGCSNDPAQWPGDAPSATTAHQETAAARLLTVDATALAQRWRLFGAQQKLIQECMLRQGLTYVVTAAGPEPDVGITTADTIGAASPPAYPISGPPAGTIDGVSPQDRYVRSLPPAARDRYLAAYSGPDTQTATLTLPSGAVVRYLTGGCEGQARAALYGSVRTAMEDVFVPQDVTVLLQHFLAADRPYQAALASWQHCMALAGWPVSSPAAAIAGLQATTGAALDQRQHAEAAADGRCDAASSLRRTGSDRRAVFLAQQSPATMAWLERVEQARQRTIDRLGEH